MPEGFHIAEAYVTVDPDTDDFPEKLKAQLEAVDYTLKVPVEPDVPADFMARAEAEIRAQGDGAVDVPVSPDADGFAEKLQAAVDAEEAGVRGQPVEVPVDPDAAGFAEKLQATLDAEEAAARAQPVQVPVSPDDAGFDAKLGAAVEQARVFVTSAGGVTVPVAADASLASFARVQAAAQALSSANPVTMPVTANAAQGLASVAAAVGQARVFVAGTGGVTIPVSYAPTAAGIAQILAVNAALRTATGSTNALAAATAAAGNTAGSAYRLWGTGIQLTSTAMHGLVSGTIELAAVLIPATVAAGAWAAAWLQGSVNVYQHIMSVYTATEAMANIGAKTAGQMLGLGDALQKAQNAANPDVYQALGAAINIVNSSGGDLAKTGVEIGNVFDTFLAKVAYEMQSGGATQMHGLLSDMVTDLTQIGQILGNTGHALANFASDMPGAANLLLDFVDAVSKGIELVSELPRPLIEAAFALHEFNTWGSVASAMLGRLGLATTELSGGFGSYFLVGDRFIGILQNLIGVLPAAAFGVLGLVQKIPLLGEAVIGTTADLEAGRAATMGWIEGLSALETLGISAAAAGLAILVDKIVTAQTATEKFTASLQQAAENASDLNVLSVISSNLSQIQDRTAQSAASLRDMGGAAGAVNDTLSALSSHGLAPLASGFTDVIAKTNAAAQSTSWIRGGLENLASVIPGATGLVSRLWDAFSGATTARAAMSELQASEVQQVQDSANVVTGAEKIATTYHMSIPAAMALAQSAGVNLTNSIVTQSGAFNALGFKIKDAVSGYAAMDQGAGTLGNDMLAVAIQTGEAGTQVSKLNSAWDAFMSGVTGGTSALASMEQAVTNLSTGTNQVTNILGKAGSVSLTVQQFAASLKSFTGTGATAWQNFDQVVGSSAPQLIDWLRTAASEGALGADGFGKFDDAVRSVVAQLLPFASQSKTALAQVSALAQEGGGPATTSLQALKQWVDAGDHSLAGLSGTVSTATQNMSDMAQIASNLGDVMQSAFTSAISAASLKASGFDAAVANLTTVLQHNSASSPAAVAAARAVTSAWDRAQSMAGTVASQATKAQAQINAMHGKNVDITASTGQARSAVSDVQQWIDGLHGKTVNITVAVAAAGNQAALSKIGLGVYTGATGGVIPGYAPGQDTVLAAVSPGEGMLVPEAVRALGGKPAIDAINRRFGGARVARGNKTGTYASGGIAADASFRYPNDIFNITVTPQIGLPAPGGTQTLQSVAGTTGTLPSTLTTAQRAAAEKAGKTIADSFADAWKQTTAQIKADTTTAIDDIRKYYTGPQATQLINALKVQGNALAAIASKYSSVTAEISAMKAYAANITSSLASSTGLSAITAPTNTTTGATGPITGAYIQAQLSAQLHTLQRFFNAISKLQKDKLGKTLIAQVIALGPTAGLQYANAILAGGSKLAKELASTEAAIGKTETKIGQEAADIQYGQSTAKGFLSGLQKEQSSLHEEMRKLGDEIAKELAKDLGVPLKDIKLGPLPAAKKTEPEKKKDTEKEKKTEPGRHIAKPDVHIHLEGSKGKLSTEEMAAVMHTAGRQLALAT